MKVQSTINPEKWEIRKVVDGQAFIKLRKNVEQVTNEEGDTIFQYDEVEVVLPKVQKFDEFIEQNFEEVFNLNTIELIKEMRTQRLEALEAAMMEVITNG